MGLTDPAARQKFIESMLAGTDSFGGLLLLDAEGRDLARAGDARAAASNMWKEAAASHGPRAFLEGEPGHEMLFAAVPLAPGGGPAATLLAGMRTEWLWRHLPAVHLERGQHFYLLSPQGRVMAQTAGQAVSRAVPLPPANGYGTGLQGTRVLRASRSLTVLGQPLALLAERDASDALFPFFATLRGMIALLAALMGSATVVGIWTVRRLTGPVLELRDAACAIEAGDLSRQAPVRHEDEVGELADAFNRMTARLRDSLHRLEDEMAQHAETEVHLKQSVSMLRAMFDATVDAVVVVGNDGTIVNWSKRFAEMWHLPEDGPGLLTTPELWTRIAAHLTNPEPFLASRDAVNDRDTYGTALLNTRDGRIVEEYSRPNVLEGAIAGCVWCFRDVTEQARRERELRESEERFRTMAFSSRIATCTTRT
ncbi:MAG: HAMP domain-containing protein [Candidatus Hydrogenedentes bacterium]|nr:HAMP domain-containing protein [Candidatus Hydrogenedentota bacterium]